LENLFQERLQEKQARKSGICPIREELHNQLFDEIIRQATVNLPERGILLMKIRDHLKMTFAAYQTLYEGSLVFGNRKAHVA
jgi:dynein light intermediate chain